MDDSGTLLIAVDENDRETGVVGKMTAHRKGILHRAFSVFVFDEAGRLLLQRRADDKYHSGGLWSNTCCSHPRAGESLLAAAHRRLREEMGLECPLRAVFGFVYRAALDGGLVEHEFDHVVVGRFGVSPLPTRLRLVLPPLGRRRSSARFLDMLEVSDLGQYEHSYNLPNSVFDEDSRAW